MKPKRAGCCSNCDTVVFETITVDDDGWPKRLGKPLDHAWRVTFAMQDGSSANMTYCADCIDKAGEPRFVVYAWNKALAAFARDIERPGTTEAAKAVVADLVTKNRPLGLIAKRRWTDVMEDERRGAR